MGRKLSVFCKRRSVQLIHWKANRWRGAPAVKIMFLTLAQIMLLMLLTVFNAGCASSANSPTSARNLASQNKLTAAHLALRQGNLPLAESQYREVLEIPPTRAILDNTLRGEALLGLGRTTFRQGRRQRALELLKRASSELQGSIHYSDSLAALGEAHLELHALRLAEQQLRAAFDHMIPGEKRRHVAMLLSLLYLESGLKQEAQRFQHLSGKPNPKSFAHYQALISPQAPKAPPTQKHPTKKWSRNKAIAGHPRGLRLIRRSEWKARKIRKNSVALGKVTAVTIHHTGEETPPDLTSRRDVAQHINALQRYTQNVKRWADIGYHYLIDPRGNIWEGRAITRQGAHAGDPKLHKGNIGIAVMGNFDRRKPSEAQVQALSQLIQQLTTHHRVSLQHVYTHTKKRNGGGLGYTACPGKHLISLMPRIRRQIARRP